MVDNNTALQLLQRQVDEIEVGVYVGVKHT